MKIVPADVAIKALEECKEIVAELEAENARITDAYKLLIDKLNKEDDNEINISP